LATLAAAFLFGGSASHADPYRWCAVYGGEDGGSARNCGFVTIEQCRATISGIGGWCEPNGFYTGSDRDESRRPSRRRHDSYR
jgi:hypothetical protein